MVDILLKVPRCNHMEVADDESALGVVFCHHSSIEVGLGTDPDTLGLNDEDDPLGPLLNRPQRARVLHNRMPEIAVKG
jgi:hypothetical protein